MDDSPPGGGLLPTQCARISATRTPGEGLPALPLAGCLRLRADGSRRFVGEAAAASELFSGNAVGRRSGSWCTYVRRHVAAPSSPTRKRLHRSLAAGGALTLRRCFDQ